MPDVIESRISKLNKYIKITGNSVINLGILVIHVAVVLEFIFNRFEIFSNEGWVGLFFIGSLSIFWGVVITSNFKKSKQGLQDEICQFQLKLNENSKLIQGHDKYKNYANGYIEFAEAFSILHDLQRFIEDANVNSSSPEHTIGRMHDFFEKFCTQISFTFGSITDSKHISTCIKILHSDNSNNDDSYVKTLVRDQINTNVRSKDENIEHPVTDNTSYRHVLTHINTSEIERSFFSNNLPLYRDYLNTSFRIYNQENYSEDRDNEYRENNWKLPYRSTIVSGIHPAVSTFRKSKFVVGFICVDSPLKEAFTKELDVPILNLLGDLLYNIMKDFNSYLSNQKKLNNEKSHEINERTNQSKSGKTSLETK